MLIWRCVELPSTRFGGVATGGRNWWAVSFPAPTVLVDLQAQVEAESHRQQHGVACMARGMSTTSVRMAKKMAGWDA